MATKTIARSLTETTTQPDIAQQLSQPPEESTGRARGFGESLPLRMNHLNPNETQVRATLINAFRRRLHPQRQSGGGGGPPDDDDPGYGGGDPPDEEPNEPDLQDHVPIPQAW